MFPSSGSCYCNKLKSKWLGPIPKGAGVAGWNRLHATPWPLIDPVLIRTGVERVHLETALALAIHGSFNRTAAALNMKASTVSRRIRDLEFQLGTAIFERNRHGVAPTPIGMMFLERAGDLLCEFHGLVAGIRRIGDGKAGTVAVGFHGLIGNGLLADLLFRKHAALPDLHLIPVEMPRDRLAGALSSYQIDIAIVRGAPDIASTDTLPLADERLVAVLPQKHSLAGSDSIGWSALANETVMLSRPDCGAALIKDFAQRMRVPGMNGSVEIHDIGTCSLLPFVARGRGVSISTEAIRAHSFEGVAVCDLADMLEVHACWDPHSPNPVVERFLRLLRYGNPHRQSVCVPARA